MLFRSDGRTTIFDYWGVPEFQQWVNGGQFNEELLTTEQKTLRQFYGNLNAFVLKNEAVYAGGFYDLQYVNANGQSFNYDGNIIFSYLRHTDDQKILFVYNFHESDTVETLVKVPQDVWTNVLKLGNTGDYKLKPVFPLEVPQVQLRTADITSTGVHLELPPISAFAFEIVPK